VRKLLIIFISLHPAFAASQTLGVLPDAPMERFLVSPAASLPGIQVSWHPMPFEFPVLASTHGDSLDDVSSAQPPAPDAEGNIFPHSQTAPWWISGQANIIFQAHPGFHSPYQGANSFHNAGEYKTSMLGTVFTGYQPHRNLRYNTDFLVDFESAGGRGLSEALGLAGFSRRGAESEPEFRSLSCPRRDSSDPWLDE
jgi:high affinity Mn2+ porin